MGVGDVLTIREMLEMLISSCVLTVSIVFSLNALSHTYWRATVLMYSSSTQQKQQSLFPGGQYGMS